MYTYILGFQKPVLFINKVIDVMKKTNCSVIQRVKIFPGHLVLQKLLLPSPSLSEKVVLFPQNKSKQKIIAMKNWVWISNSIAIIEIF